MEDSDIDTGLTDAQNTEYLAKLKSRLFQMMGSGDYSDVTFTIEGESIHCHKNILAAMCPYFDTMFKSEITGVDARIIDIKTMPRNIFQAIIHFIYTGEIVVTAENAQLLLEASDMMQFDELRQNCCKFFIKEMDPTNCCGIWQLASSVNSTDLQTETFTFICQHFPEVSVDNEEFLSMDGQLVQQLILHPHVYSPSEDFLVERAVEWFEVDCESRLSIFIDLLHNMPLHNVSLKCLQYNLLKHSQIRQVPELVTYIQDVVNHVIFLAPVPESLISRFPRTKTDYVEGMAVFSRESVRSGGARMKLSFYRFENEKLLTAARSEDLPFDFVLNEEVSMCSVDTSMYVCTADGLQRYDLPTQMWTPLSKWSVGAKHRLVLTEGKRLFTLEYSHYKCPVWEYDFLENTWTSIGALNKKLTTADFAVCEHQGVIYVWGGNSDMPGFIQGFNTHTNTGYILDIRLPSAPTGLNCLVYKNHVIVTSMEACYIYSLSQLHQSFMSTENKAQKMAVDEEDPPVEKAAVTHILSKPQPMENQSQFGKQLGLGNTESLVNTDSDELCHEVMVITKPGLNRKDYCLERIGSELVVLAGKTHHPKFCREVQVTNIDQYLLEDNTSQWRTVASFSPELNRYNISLYKSTLLKFKQ